MNILKKEIYCPICHSRIIDSEVDVHTELRVVKTQGHSPPQNLWVPDYYIKCWKCKSEVGLRKIHLPMTS